MNNKAIISAIQHWLTTFVIKYDICPFAQHVHHNDQIRYQLCESEKLEHCLEMLVLECQYLDQHPETETTLLILARVGQNFDDYLDLCAIAEQLLVDLGYEGNYQLASFHPDYCFETSAPNDPANYTNRSPYPLLHIIRETSISKALQNYAHPELIPEKNIALTRQLGLETLRTLLNDCK